MFNRGLFCKFSVILAASAIIFSGCGDPEGNIDGPSIGSNPETRKIDNENAKIEAIKLYVDAVMLNEIKDWDQAITKLNAAIEYAPEFSLAYSFKGDIYQLTKKYEVSADSYEEATKIDPWSFKDFSNLGKVCQIIEDFSRAVKAYVSACELKTDDFDVHLGAARCFYELKDYELAFGYGQRAKEITPEKGDVDVLLGDIYVARSDAYLSDKQNDAAKAVLIDAIASYKRALEVDGNKPKILISLAVAYTKMAHYYDPLTEIEDKKANYSAAEELLLSAIEKDTKTGTAYKYLGFVQLNLHNNDLDLAMNSYKKAAEIDEKDWLAHKGIGVVYMLKFNKLRDEAVKRGELDQLDRTFKLKAFEKWDVSLTIKPDQPELINLYKDCRDL